MEGKDKMVSDTGVNKTDEKFFANLENNVDEMRAETASGAEIEEELERKTATSRDSMAQKVAVSEERARELLREETQRVSQSFKGTDAKRKKAIIGIITVAVVLCAAGLAFVLIMNTMR